MNNPFLKAFGVRIKSLRLQKGYSQEQLGLIAELDRTYISGIERGLRNLSLINLERLALALNVEPAELLKFQGANNV
ncbi:MAG: helix-turn-helix transcriptional regulator [Methylotenera sp.]|nr:helix-turn-helix transcriptional regulator [Methylotenera sp.]MDD4926345.1 helix-turn-helix transcriptional regulator [Methylotenera sp.]